MDPQTRVFDISIDTGGTFTDCIARDCSGKSYTQKVLSNGTLRGHIIGRRDAGSFFISESWGLERDIIRGFSFRLLKASHPAVRVKEYDTAGRLLVLDAGLDADVGEFPGFEICCGEEAPVLAARLITGTALGEDFPVINFRLGSTRGTNALLEGKGAKTALFVTRGFADLLAIGNQQRPDIFALRVIKPGLLAPLVAEIDERIDARGNILKPLNSRQVNGFVKSLKEEGVESVAVSLLNAAINPVHEQQVRALFMDAGMKDVSVSTGLSGMIKYLQRTETTVVNAYLSPVIRNYLQNISGSLGNSSIHVMTSAGGLVRDVNYSPRDSLLSGPAGGVVGADYVSRLSGFEKTISFDMGGTSTDVSRIDGRFDYRFDLRIGRAHILSPAISIETVAAGGGSICNYDGYRLSVGPESAGAHPGPACYGAGGPLTITDVNLLLGRLDTSRFGIPVFPHESEARLNTLIREMEERSGKRLQKEQVLTGFLDIANEIMAGAIRKISIARGYDPSAYALTAFGGAGGMHACAIAGILGLSTIIIPERAGLLSALGIRQARIERIAEKQILSPLEDCKDLLDEFYDQLVISALEDLSKEGVSGDRASVEQKIAFLRFKGQDSTVDVEYDSVSSLYTKFKKKYISVYGHWPGGRIVELESIRVIAGERMEHTEASKTDVNSYLPASDRVTRTWYQEQWCEARVYFRKNLHPGALISGFAILLDEYSTTVVEAGWELSVDAHGNAIISREQGYNRGRVAGKKKQASEAELELFTHRFMAIAEDMGAMLERTALSVNVKERLDFSCALVDPQGFLVANAPHIPVHLGSLGVCVRRLKETMDMSPGDTIVTNHPAYGGSHLPDITLVTPVYLNDSTHLGYVVNRAHHAEIGGLLPASMPAHATSLEEEGVVITPEYLVRKGKSCLDRIEKILRSARYPSRAVDENLADLGAALAANLSGQKALLELTSIHGTGAVLRNMKELRNHAARKMSGTLLRTGDHRFTAREMLDDGTPLQVTVTISGGRCHFDFSGTGGVHPGNLNANASIVNSVIIYVLRLMINEPIPLNDGIMDPITLHIPGGILNPVFPADPSLCPAVVGGNVETSQRLTDTLLKALKLVACSQGTMNNLLFGNDRFSYYETICGGCGAGQGFAGASAVHHHMTNTRITDPEVLEHRYPVRLLRFSIRQGSGGRGRYPGGNGVVREIQFLEPVSLSILSQHRTTRPFGMEGGKPGKAGTQYVVTSGNRKIRMKGIDQANLAAGDRIVIKTPGGGGYGTEEKEGRDKSL